MPEERYSDLTIGEELVFSHVREEMRLRALDSALIVYHWDDQENGPSLALYRGKNKESIVFERSDLERWIANPATSWAKYSGRVIEAIGRLLQHPSE